MTLETADRRGRSALGFPQAQSTRLSSRDPAGDRGPTGDAGNDRLQVGAATTKTHAPSGLQVEALTPEREDQHVEHVDDKRRDEPPKGMLRRRPFAFAGALILLFAALPTGYLYWDLPAGPRRPA